MPAWDTYVRAHPMGNFAHQYGWRHVVEQSYKHRTLYLVATDGPGEDTGSIRGILPIVYMRHVLFGRRFISMPFLDMGGVLADDDETERALVLEAMEIARKENVPLIELRQQAPMGWCSPDERQTSPDTISVLTRTHKVSMILDLPESSDALMSGFKAKLRNQIKKPMKEGLCVKTGGLELLPDFYQIFAVNMRDLGSPVHSKRLMHYVLKYFSENADIFIVYKETIPVACGLTLGFKRTVSNLWASSLRKFSRLSPNMLLYWKMLEHACDQGYRFFNFGRSTPDEGTFRFKQQWGAEPHPLHWQFIDKDGSEIGPEMDKKAIMEKAAVYWKRLPTPATRIIGPLIRRNIGL